MATDTARTGTFTVDPEHGGLRLVIGLAFIGVLVGGYLIASLLLPQSSGFNVVAALISVVAAVVITQVLDSALKRRWSSGRVVEVIDSAVRLRLRDNVQSQINGDAHVNVLQWYFEIKRRTRVPRGWFVVATALHQDDTYIVTYTFMSPDDLNGMRDLGHYTRLVQEQKDEDMRVAAQRRRLLLAESIRWNDGAEMRAADYATYLDLLRAEFPAWMPRY